MGQRPASGFAGYTRLRGVLLDLLGRTGDGGLHVVARRLDSLDRRSLHHMRMHLRGADLGDALLDALELGGAARGGARDSGARGGAGDATRNQDDRLLREGHAGAGKRRARRGRRKCNRVRVRALVGSRGRQQACWRGSSRPAVDSAAASARPRTRPASGNRPRSGHRPRSRRTPPPAAH